jgi:CDP-diacylglycerol---serine O-phosphatidyltransferase
LAMLPLMIWLEYNVEWARDYRLIGPWILVVALMMISNVATFSWSSIKIRPSYRFMALAVFGLIVALLIAAPYVGLMAICGVYAGLIPFSVMSYARVKRARRTIANEAA